MVLLDAFHPSEALAATRDHGVTILSGARFVEVPVNYLPRVGVSSVTGDPRAAIAVGLRMIGLLLRFRLVAPRQRLRPAAMAVQGSRDDAQKVHEQLSL